MKTKLILMLFSAMVIFGCKNDKSENDVDATKTEAVSESFKVTLYVIAQKQDLFSLYYTEDGSTNFQNEPVLAEFVGNENMQNVVYTLPEDVFPTQLRLDFGSNKDQQDIILKSVVLEYKGKKHEITGSAIGTFFRADESKCEFDPATGTIHAKIVDGVRQSPSLYPQESLLQPEIEKLAK